MANGFCPALLRHINDIAGDNSPERKLHIAGFLQMALCCANSSVSPVNTDQFSQGHNRPLTVWYRERPLVSETQSTANCDINGQPARKEWTIPSLRYRSHSQHIPESLIRQYCKDASDTRALGQPPTTVMNEVYDMILQSANVVMKAINRDLVALMSTEFGVNAATGNYSGSVININQDGSKYILNNGVVQIVNDAQTNQFCGAPCVVGDGIYRAFMNAQGMTGLNSGGMDLSQNPLPRFFYDNDTNALWGTNAIGVFQPGSVKFLSYPQNLGSFAYDRGITAKTTFALPINDFACPPECLNDLRFDLHLKYNDCPVEIEGGGTLEPGWQAIVSKTFGLWVQPDNAYKPGDPLYQTNGTLKYWVSNDNYSGGTYSKYA